MQYESADLFDFFNIFHQRRNVFFWLLQFYRSLIMWIIWKLKCRQEILVCEKKINMPSVINILEGRQEII